MSIQAMGQFSLSGRAYAMEDGQPLAGVWVNLLDARGIDVARYASIRTNKEGVFEFSGLTEGVYRLELVRMHLVEEDTVGFRIMTGKITLDKDRNVATAFSGVMANQLIDDSKAGQVLTSGARSGWLEWRILFQSRVYGTDDDREIFESLMRSPPLAGSSTTSTLSNTRPAIPHRVSIVGLEPDDAIPFQFSFVLGESRMRVVEGVTPYTLDVADGWIAGILQATHVDDELILHVQRVGTGTSFTPRSMAKGGTLLIDTMVAPSVTGASELQHYVSAKPQ